MGVSAKLKVRVLARGAPVESARVVLLKPGELDSSPGSPLPGLYEAFTGEDGSAELEAPPGEYAVSITVRKVFRAVLDGGEELTAELLEDEQGEGSGLRGRESGGG